MILLAVAAIFAVIGFAVWRVTTSRRDTSGSETASDRPGSGNTDWVASDFDSSSRGSHDSGESHPSGGDADSGGASGDSGGGGD